MFSTSGIQIKLTEWPTWCNSNRANNCSLGTRNKSISSPNQVSHTER